MLFSWMVFANEAGVDSHELRCLIDFGNSLSRRCAMEWVDAEDGCKLFADAIGIRYYTGQAQIA